MKSYQKLYKTAQPSNTNVASQPTLSYIATHTRNEIIAFNKLLETSANFLRHLVQYETNETPVISYHSENTTTNKVNVTSAKINLELMSNLHLSAGVSIGEWSTCELIETTMANIANVKPDLSEKGRISYYLERVVPFTQMMLQSELKLEPFNPLSTSRMTSSFIQDIKDGIMPFEPSNETLIDVRVTNFMYSVMKDETECA